MDLLIWGTGGLGLHVVSALQSQAEHPYDRIAFLQDLPIQSTHILGCPIIGNREYLRQVDQTMTHVFAAGSTPSVRFAMAAFIKSLGLITPSFVDPSAIVRPSARLGQGCLIEAFAFVGENAIIGDYVLMGNYASAAHDCQVGDFSSLYLGSRALGGTKLETGCLLGSSASLYPGCTMGEWSKASMASAIFEDVPAYATVVGNPAQIKKRYPSRQSIQLYSI